MDLVAPVEVVEDDDDRRAGRPAGQGVHRQADAVDGAEPGVGDQDHQVR